MKAYLLFISILLLVHAPAEAQKTGKLEVTFASQALDTLMRQNVRSNESLPTVDGYRIQIYSGSGIASKAEAMAAQTRFETLYPSERAYVIYSAPFWRVRVGNYRFRSEAMKLLSSLRSTFPGSYMVRDNTVRKTTFRSAK